jgi:hypothetical protein
LKCRQQFKGEGQLHTVVVLGAAGGLSALPLKADIRRANCHVYEIFILEKPRTKLDPLAVMRTYLIRQAAPPNF